MEIWFDNFIWTCIVLFKRHHLFNTSHINVKLWQRSCNKYHSDLCFPNLCVGDSCNKQSLKNSVALLHLQKVIYYILSRMNAPNFRINGNVWMILHAGQNFDRKHVNLNTTCLRRFSQSYLTLSFKLECIGQSDTFIIESCLVNLKNPWSSWSPTLIQWIYGSWVI